MMRRREFFGAVLAGALSWPLAARGQVPGRTYRLGVLFFSPRNAPAYVAMFDELRRNGFVEGQNLNIDERGFALRDEQHLAAVAQELVKARVDILVCGGDATTLAAQRATATIPIVSITDDMVGSGLVRSLAKPGGNTSGVSILATELNAKRQELIIEAVPGIRRLAALSDPNSTAPRHLEGLPEAARARGVELSILRAARTEEIAPAIDAAKTAGAEAINVLASPFFQAQRRLIMERATGLRLPAIFQWSESAADGGFAAYGPSLVGIFRELLTPQVVKVLRGAPPADLPVLQPTKFELVFNLKTARTIGIDVPRPLLQRADEVIE